MGASALGFWLRVLLALYIPFLLSLMAVIGLGEAWLFKAFLGSRSVIWLVAAILLAVPFFQLLLAAACALVVRLPPPMDPLELKLPKVEREALFTFVRGIARKRDLPEPDRILLSADTVAHVYENKAGETVLVLGGMAIGLFSQDSLAGIIAHELGHFGAGDTQLSRRCHRHFVRMQVLEEALLFSRLPTGGGEGMAAVNPALAFSMNLLNPFPWLVVAYHRAISLVYAAHSRRQEYAADRHEVDHVGKKAAAAALVHLEVTQRLPWTSLEGIAEMCLATNTLPNQLFEEQSRLTERIADFEWKDTCRKALAEATGWFDSHPCLRERLAAMGVPPKQALKLKIDTSSPPAKALFHDWRALEQCMSAEIVGLCHEMHESKRELGRILTRLFR